MCILFINSQYHVLAIRYYFLFTPHIQIKVRDGENKTSSLLFSFQLMVTVNKLILLLSSAPNMLEQRVR